MKTILVVDDEKNYLLVLGTLLMEDGYEVLKTEDPRRALQMIEEDIPDLLITDMKMPGLSGIDLLKAVKKRNPHIPVIILTAYGTIETAVDAMKLGAYHYILKPFQNDEIKITVKRALKIAELEDERIRLNQELSARFGLEGLVAESAAIRKVYGLIEQVAPTKTTVLVQGESGTGKELVARAIHTKSPRTNRPFVAVNCGALSETLLESELFGHEKGAFTGATAQKKGRFEMADGGTLFLDEVGTMSSALQVRLLRVLQEQAFERVGGTRTIKVDVRIIAASNQNLKKLIESGSFREDLYYRLNVFSINLPPLRERREDILPLANYFLTVYGREVGKPVVSISIEAAELIRRHPWPGNVRELKNAIERAVVVCKGETVGLNDLPDLSGHVPDTGKTAKISPDISKPLPVYLEEIEKEIIVEALKASEDVHARAARLLGISPTSLQYKLNKYNLS